MTIKLTGECCDEPDGPCCPLTENCECIPDPCCGVECGECEKCVAYTTRYWERVDENDNELWGTESYWMCCPEDSTPTQIHFNVDKTGGFVTECCYSDPFIDIVYYDGDVRYNPYGYACLRCFKHNWKEGATTGPCAKFHGCYGEGDTPVYYEGEIDCGKCSNFQGVNLAIQTSS